MTSAAISSSAALCGATSHRPAPLRRPRRQRDLSRAKSYRAEDIFHIHGIPSSTLSDMARRAEDPAPSRLIAPRGGRRGIRLYPVADFEAWLARQGVGAGVTEQ